MAYIPKEIVAKAKEMDLLTYLSHYEPSELVKLGGGVYSTRTHDSLKISNGRWMWWSQSIGGRSAIDYLIKVKGYSFIDAVKAIVGDVDGDSPTATAEDGGTQENISRLDSLVNQPKTEQKPKKLNLPERNDNEDRIIKYLKERGIDQEIIAECINKDLIYESKKYHSVIFVGKDEKGEPKFGCYRATDSSRAMGDLWGSNKRYSFQTRCEGSGVLHVFEGAIDLLSYATLLKMKGYNWQRTNLLSLSGVYVPQKSASYRLPVAIYTFLKNNPQINKIYLQLDKDRAGMMAAQALQKALQERYTVSVVPPPQGKDYNDYLQILQKNQSKIQEGDVNLMDERKLTVLVIKPNEAPKVVEINDSLRAMQEVVGGYIQEVMPFKDDVAIVCNEEGKIQKLPPNRAIHDGEGKVTDIIVGDFFICKAPVEGDTFESLTEDDIKKYKEMFQYPERFSRSGDEIIASKIKPNKEEAER